MLQNSTESSVTDSLLEVLSTLNSWVWGAPFLILFFGLGIYLTFALRALQFRRLPYALKLAFGKQDTRSKGDISQYQSLMTALAATMGIGNIAGVAVAVSAGGLGSLFWMWLTAMVGMTIKYAEALMAVKYRVVDKNGEMAGGPMYFINKGLGWRILPALFAGFGLLVSLGGGNMLQANAVADVMATTFHVDRWISGTLLTLLVAISIVGGIRSIGRVAGLLVPLMALFYLVGAVLILVHHMPAVPAAFASIFTEALSGSALTGGVLGFYAQEAVRVGMSRGLMTSEAGLGTGSIAAAAARTDCPGRQALVSMTSSFLTTIIMCTMTALVLEVTGVIGLDDDFGHRLNGAALTVTAFNSVFPWAGHIVSLSLVFFAFTTIIGYAYYAEKCLEYLCGEKGIHSYRLFFTCMVLAGSLLQLDLVWTFTDVANGLMAYPNLMGLIALATKVVNDSYAFERKLKNEQTVQLALDPHL